MARPKKVVEESAENAEVVAQEGDVAVDATPVEASVVEAPAEELKVEEVAEAVAEESKEPEVVAEPEPKVEKPKKASKASAEPKVGEVKPSETKSSVVAEQSTIIVDDLPIYIVPCEDPQYEIARVSGTITKTSSEISGRDGKLYVAVKFVMPGRGGTYSGYALADKV